MRHLGCALALTLLGCGASSSDNTGDGGTTDFAAAYVGAWSGTATIVSGSSNTTHQAKIPIAELSKTNGQLTAAVSGTLACNGGSASYSLTYTSSQKDAYATLTAGDDGPGLGANIASESAEGRLQDVNVNRP